MYKASGAKVGDAKLKFTDPDSFQKAITAAKGKTRSS